MPVANGEPPRSFLLGQPRLAWTDIERIRSLRILVQACEENLAGLYRSPIKDVDSISEAQATLKLWSRDLSAREARALLW